MSNMKLKTKLELLSLEALKAKAYVEDEYVKESITKKDWGLARKYIRDIMDRILYLEKIAKMRTVKEKEEGNANRSEDPRVTRQQKGGKKNGTEIKISKVK